jgi:hypothetical protein
MRAVSLRARELFMRHDVKLAAPWWAHRWKHRFVRDSVDTVTLNHLSVAHCDESQTSGVARHSTGLFVSWSP